MKTVVVAAYDKELTPFRASASFSEQVARGLLALEAIGVGPIHAAVGAATLRAKLASSPGPWRALLVGTAGTYNAASLPLGSVISASSVSLATSHGSVPELAGTTLEPTWHLEGPSVVRARVLNTMGITTKLKHTLASEGDVEHMEAYAFAAAFARDTYAICLGVTNEVGPDGRMQWLANESKTMQKVYATVAAQLASLQ